MGIVYKARHLALNRLVAIKVLNRIQQATEREILRLQMEGETVANLQHPNIVPLYQMGEFAGLPFLTFEYIDGGTLADRIAGRPQPPREVAEMVELLARAVQLAHQQGVLHRDLKPANVLLNREGVPKIADFGLARRLDNQEFSTELIAGTANYMSPEQAWGDSKTNPLTPATDVYSLGAVLYELLTGRPPFASESREQTIKDVWSKPPAPPCSLAPNVPPDLQTICLKCLEKEPSRRYSSAAELAHDLRRWLNSEPIIARPTGRFEKAVLWCRRDPIFAGVVVALILAVLAGTTGSSWLALIYRGKRDEAEQAQIAAVQNANLAEKARTAAEEKQKQLSVANDHLERRLYETSILSMQRDVEWMGQFSFDLEKPNFHHTPRRWLSDHLSQSPPHLRNIEWDIRNRQMQGSLLTRPVTRHMLETMDVSRDGRWIATSAVNMEEKNQEEPVRVWSTDDWKLCASFGHRGQQLKFSPDGELLFVENPSTGMEVWEWRKHQLIHTFRRSVRLPDSDKDNIPYFQPSGLEVALSPNGRILALGGDGYIQLYPLKERRWGDNEYYRSAGTDWPMALQFSPDSRQLVALSYRQRSEHPDHAWKSQLQIWNSLSGDLIREWPLDGTFKLMCLSNDGRRCAVAAIRSPDNKAPFELRLYELPDGKVRSLRIQPEPLAIRFNRDGSDLLVADERGTVEVIGIDRLEPRALLEGHQGRVVAVDSLPDGRIVTAGADGLVKVWPRDGQSRLPHRFDGNRPYALSGDGRELAVATEDGAVRRFDLNDDSPLPELPSLEFKPLAGFKTVDGKKPPAKLGIAGLCYAIDSRQLMVAYSDLTVRTWQLAKKQVTASVSLVGPDVTRPDPALAHASGIFSASMYFPRILFSDDRKYAAWTGQGQFLPPATLMVWDLASGTAIVNVHDLPFGKPWQFEFATTGGRTWAVVYERDRHVEVAGHPYDPGKLVSAWDLTTGKKQSDANLARELRAAHGPRLIEASYELSIADSMTGLVLLELPLGGRAVGQPSLSTDHSRLAVATDHGIAVFDTGPMPEFALPEDGATSAAPARQF